MRREGPPHPAAGHAGCGCGEPVRGGVRPIGMVLTTTLRKAVPATVLAALLTVPTAGCGTQSGLGEPDGAPRSTTAAQSSSPSPSSGTIADRVVYFSSSPGATKDGHQVLHDRAEVSRFAGAFTGLDPQAAARIEAAGRTTDFTRQVLVAWTATTGCSAATAAALTASGDRLELHVSQPKPPPECVAAFHVTVVFQVAKERIPAQPVFG